MRKLLGHIPEGWEGKGPMSIYEGIALEKREGHLFHPLRQVGQGWVD